jgi:CBS domain containing-hemolysin-like protein
VDRVPALRLLQADLPGDLAPQSRRQRRAAFVRHAAGHRHELRHSEEEIRHLLDSEQQSELPEQKREMLANVFELSHRTARQIMVPRADVVYVSTTRSMAENLDIIAPRRPHPLSAVRGDLDHVVGLIHIKDLLRAEKPPTSLTTSNARSRSSPRRCPPIACCGACAPSACTWRRSSTSTAASTVW